MKREYPLHCWLMGGIEHGNLGDHQITTSMEEFLLDIEPELVIHEVLQKTYFERKNDLKEKVLPDDILIFNGGGNIGTLWPKEEELRRDAFQTWPDNPKIIFPQSVFFSSDDQGERCLEESSRIYRTANCMLALREPISYAFAREHFGCRLFLTPDIVLYSKIDMPTSDRSGCLLLLRRDKERALTDEDQRRIEAAARARFGQVRVSDTVRAAVGRGKRDAMLRQLHGEIRASRLVVTDRLHGMLLSAVSGTPCVVFTNNYHKIRTSMQWVEDLPYIRFAERAEDLPAAIDALDLTKEYEYPQEEKRALFAAFRAAVAEMLAAGRKPVRDQRPKVSVVIPAGARAPHPEDCLNSVLEQTLRDTEILCVSDGTADGPRAILEDCARRDPRVVIIDRDDGDVAGGRNAGLRRANGAYLFFPDCDARIEPQALELLYDKMEEMQLDLLFFDAAPTAEDGHEASCPEICTGRELMQLFRSRGEDRSAAGGYLSRTAFLKEQGLTFAEGTLYADELFTFQCMSRAKRAAYLPGALYHRQGREDTAPTGEPGFSRAYGYVAGAAAMLRHLQTLGADAAACAVYEEQIDAVLKKANAMYEQLDAEEKDRYTELPAQEAAYFRLLMLSERRDAIRCAQLEQGLTAGRREKERLEKENQRMRSANEKLEKEKDRLRRINGDMSRSLSFRIGRVITWLPRGIRRLLRRLAGKAF